MKKIFITYTFVFISFLILNGCKKALDIQPASELSSAFLETKKGAVSLLNSAYGYSQWIADDGANRLYAEEATTDVLVNFRGALNVNVQPIQVFSWQADNVFFINSWTRNYLAIRDANNLLAVLDANKELTTVEKTQFAAEAKFIRGLSYYFLYNWFGPVPLINKSFTGSNEDFSLPRAEENQIMSAIEEDLTSAASDLPPTLSQTGKATKGAALGALTKFYMITKNWSKAAATAKQVIDLNQYILWPDPTTLFSLQNEGNKEMIFVFPCIALEGYGNVWIANALPPQYPTPVFNTATQVCVPAAFYRTFEANDKRRTMILTSYINTLNRPIDLLTGVEYQNPRSFKYPLDVNAANRMHAGDIPYLRYADILLCRAEALVMSTGSVTQEALGLLNQIRVRAGLNAYTMQDAPTKEAYINLLIKERVWEFFSEGKRREDFIRQGLFIQNAISRGFPAKPHHVRFPIPQSEIDANRNLVQNTGY